MRRDRVGCSGRDESDICLARELLVIEVSGR